MRADLHTHSNRSDGTDTPAELVHKAAAVGLAVVGLADHDTYAGWDEAITAGQQCGIHVLPAVEISCRHTGVDVHLLGYGVSPHPELDAALARSREARADRLPLMLDRLSRHGMPLTAEEVLACANSSPSLGRPHVADAMVARGYVADRDEAFRDWLADGGPIFVERYAVDLTTAITLVRAAGGAPVIAHPWARRAARALTRDELAALTERGLRGVEVDHPEHTASTRAELRGLASDLGLLVTGSSDYHGRGKTNNALGCETTDPQVVEALTAPGR